MQTHLIIPYDEIAEFCQQNHIRKLALFGSVLRDDFGPDSDVDVLVEFEPGTVVGYKFVALQTALSALLGRQVHLSTPNSLSDYFRQIVLDSAQPLYERR